MIEEKKKKNPFPGEIHSESLQGILSSFRAFQEAWVYQEKMG